MTNLTKIFEDVLDYKFPEITCEDCPYIIREWNPDLDNEELECGLPIGEAHNCFIVQEIITEDQLT